MFTGPQQTLTRRGSNLRFPQTMPTEADTCRKLAVPKLEAAGWEKEPHSFAEQRRIVSELNALQAEMDALLPAILDRAFKGGL